MRQLNKLSVVGVSTSEETKHRQLKNKGQGKE
jgi:hypothetical protein